jgi:coronatine-insensitive protein 1
LQEFAGGAFFEVGEYTKYEKVKFPPRLCFLGGLTFMSKNEMPVIFPYSAMLKKLDLQYTFLTTEDHCQLIAKCPNLLVLEVMLLYVFNITCVSKISDYLISTDKMDVLDR